MEKGSALGEMMLRGIIEYDRRRAARRSALKPRSRQPAAVSKISST
jgi:hypothetical protein